MSASYESGYGPALPSNAIAELNELLWALPSSLDPGEIVAVLLERCTRLFDAPLAALWTLEGGSFRLDGTFGFTEKKAEQLWQRLGLDVHGLTPVRLDGAALHALGGFGKRRLGALLAVPLRSPRGAVGWLVFARLEPSPFSDLERSFIEILANRVGQTLENARQYQESHARAVELELLNEMARLLVSTTRLDELLDRVVERMVETLGLTWCFVQLVEGRGPRLMPRAIYHRDPEQVAGVWEFLASRPLRLDEGRSAELARTLAPITVPNLANEQVVPDDIREWLGRTGSLLIVPLVSRGEFLGAMYLVRQGRGLPLGAEMVPMATNLAAQVSVAISNAQLYEDLEAKVAERTNHLQQVYEQLAQRMVAGRDFFASLSVELQQEMGAMADALAALDSALPTDGDAPSRGAFERALAAARRLERAHDRFIERMRSGSDLTIPPREA